MQREKSQGRLRVEWTPKTKSALLPPPWSEEQKDEE